MLGHIHAVVRGITVLSISIIALALAGIAQAGQAITLLKDLNPGTADFSMSGRPVDSGGVLYFAGNTGGIGQELYTSDGSAAGTNLVQDINPGPANSNPTGITNVGGETFFRASDGVNGSELWKTDGTMAGTVLVKDIYPGSSGNPMQITSLGGIAYFSATDSAGGNELWRSDGTAAGTFIVKDINPGAGSSSPLGLIEFGGSLYFSATDGTNGTELWKSDGTGAGTNMVKDINSGSGSSSPINFARFAGSLYFAASEPVNGNELWKTGGTGATTSLVKDISPGSASGNPGSITPVGGQMVLRATDSTNGTELWSSDGTATGTVLLKDIRPGTLNGSPVDLVAAGDYVIFSAIDGTANGQEPWRTDGTAAGTYLLKDVNPGSPHSNPQFPVVVGGAVFFSATTPSGSQAIRSDGTTAGTDSITPAGSSTGFYTASSAGAFYINAFDPANGFEIWRGQPVASPSAAGLGFPGTVAKASSDPQALTITNDGAAPLHPSDLRVVGADPSQFDIDFDNCVGDTITVADSCRIDVVFNPATIGAKTAVLKLTSDDADGNLLVALSGTGTTAPPPGDTTPPETQFDAGPTGTTNDSTPTYNFSSGEVGSTFQCRLDGGAWSACTSPYTPAAQSDGTHSLEVRATDTAGNTDPSPAVRSFTIDTAAPQTAMAPAPKSLTTKKKVKVTFSFSAADSGATFECSLDGAAFAACASPRSTNLTIGKHTFSVRATDRAGNTDSTPAAASVTVKKVKKR